MYSLKALLFALWDSTPLTPVRVFVERAVAAGKAIASGHFSHEPVVLITVVSALVTELTPVFENVSVSWPERVLRAAPIALGIISSQFVTPVAK